MVLTKRMLNPEEGSEGTRSQPLVVASVRTLVRDAPAGRSQRECTSEVQINFMGNYGNYMLV